MYFSSIFYSFSPFFSVCLSLSVSCIQPIRPILLSRYEIKKKLFGWIHLCEWKFINWGREQIYKFIHIYFNIRIICACVRPYVCACTYVHAFNLNPVCLCLSCALLFIFFVGCVIPSTVCVFFHIPVSLVHLFVDSIHMYTCFVRKYIKVIFILRLIHYC